MKTFYFLAGLPRSGSTVLASILNQNPHMYVTPTSPLLDLLYLNEQAWRELPSVKANTVPEQLEAISEAIIEGCWQHIPQNIIIDKHRAWGRNLNTIKYIFKQEPKLIITVRDIPSIIASFMTLLRKSNQNPHYIDKILIERNLKLSDMDRADVLWNYFIHDPYDSFRTAYKTNKNSLLLVDYDDLVNKKSEIIKQVYEFLNLPNYTHDYNNIENVTQDDDLLAWGLENLHTIRPNLNKVSKSPREILGDEIYYKYYNMNLEFWNE